MRKVLEQLIEKKKECDRGYLEFSCEELRMVLTPGSVYEDEFSVYGENSEQIQGFITTTDCRVVCDRKEFSGTEMTLTCRIHGEYMQDGDELAGEFRFISKVGEYALPFHYVFRAPVLQSSRGEIRSLNDFAALAGENWEEALHLFYSGDFCLVLKGNDRKYSLMYKALSCRSGSRQNMEEFLVSCGRKPKINYSVCEQMLSCDDPDEDHMMSVTVMKDGWGYGCLKIVTEGTFLVTEKEMLTEDDFLGNQCILPVYIDTKRLHRGNNFGSITLQNAGCTLRIPVRIGRECRGSRKGAERVVRRQLQTELMEHYQQYRLKLIAGTTWLDRTQGLVERLVALNDREVTSRLFQAQLLILQERSHEAGWVLTHAMELMEQQGMQEEDLTAYYLYLTTLINRDGEYLRRTAERVEELWRKNKYSWRTAWFLLFLSSEYRRNPAARWAFLERQYRYGCTSPIWYMEAFLTLQQNPALLRKLDSFELQVLNYGVRRGILGEDLKEQFLYLAGRYREFSPVLLRMLIECYRMKEDERLLQEICVLLIRGGKTDKEAFCWYELGVEKELRITRLYEHYMSSMDPDEEHPVSKKALMYFAWQSNLDYEHAAYLYRYLLQHREEYEELVQKYREKINRFVTEQILKEHINKNLAYLYQELLTPQLITPQMAECLSRLLFAHRITVQSKEIVSIAVYRQDMDRVWRYPVNNYSALAVIYHRKDEIFPEDREGNRYVTGTAWESEKLMRQEPLADTVAAFMTQKDISVPEFDKYLWDRGRKQAAFTPDLVKRGLSLLGTKEISSYVKGRIQMSFLNEYQKWEERGKLKGFLETVSWEVLDDPSRREVLHWLAAEGLHEKACLWFERLGRKEIRPKALTQLCHAQMERYGSGFDDADREMAVQTGYFIFEQGKCDDRILAFLMEHYEGKLEELLLIYRESVSRNIPNVSLCRRILLQMMFTGVRLPERMEIFASYTAQGGDGRTVSAFLKECAEEYLQRELCQDPVVFEEIGKAHFRGEEVNDQEKLAFLKYYAKEGRKDVSGKEPVLRAFMEQLMAQDIRLDDFRQIDCCRDLWKSFEDRTVVQCYAAPGSKVTVHYVIRQADGQTKKPCAELMREVPGGIFCKEFVLFFGETLEYYFVKEQDRQKEVTQSNVIHAGVFQEGSLTRYGMINDLLRYSSEDDFEKLDAGLEEMYHKDYLNRNLFVMR